MPESDQGFDLKRFSVIPRTLIFIFDQDKVLLLKGAPGKKLWANKFNGIGGHVEGGENIAACARRELAEETGLTAIPLTLCGLLLVDSGGDKSILISIFKGHYNGQTLAPSGEGTLHWVSLNTLETSELVEDLPVLLERVAPFAAGDAPFFARSFYDEDKKLIVTFDD